MSGLYSLLWPALRALDAEDAHRLTIRALQAGAGALWPVGADDPVLATDVLGLHFSNPLGIAAGFDKNGEAAAGLLKLGFGFVEAGTVTPRPQAGNTRPRLFRLEEDNAVINRMGFNNDGAPALATRFAAHRPKGIVGINIGANKDSADRIEDYVTAFKTVAPYADYITVNVSSPNTAGLRALQERSELKDLLARLLAARAASGRALPFLVKIAPDLDASGVEDICALALETGLDGLIVSNTTLDRAGLRSARASEAGGLSGAPLFTRSTDMLRDVFRMTQGKLALIGVGGVGSARDAYEKILAGASLVQLYTALVYRGPSLVREIRAGLAALLKSDGYAHVQEAVGAKAQGAAVSR